jgi:hypothetical protein
MHGHGLMMLICIPMLVMAVALVASVASPVILLGAAMCAVMMVVMMVVMMRAMSHRSA